MSECGSHLFLHSRVLDWTPFEARQTFVIVLSSEQEQDTPALASADDGQRFVCYDLCALRWEVIALYRVVGGRSDTISVVIRWSDDFDWSENGKNYCLGRVVVPVWV